VRLLVAGLILAVTLLAAKRLADFVERSIAAANRHHPHDTTLATFIAALVRYGVIAMGLIAVLQQLGVQATSVIAVLGAASLAIGLALQGTLSNVAAGVMLLMQRPYRGRRQGRAERASRDGRRAWISSTPASWTMMA
jgi:small conductance mechanosensitive channel